MDEMDLDEIMGEAEVEDDTEEDTELEELEVHPATPLSPAAITAYGTFRIMARAIVDKAEAAGYENLVKAIRALLPVADYRIEETVGDYAWPIRGAIDEVLTEVRRSFEALHRVAPDAENTMAGVLVELAEEFARVLESGDDVLRIIRHDEDARYNETPIPSAASY